MRSRIRLVLIIVAALFALAALYSVAQPRLELYRLRHADPVADAQRAIRRGDYHLVAVEIVVLHVPVGDTELPPQAFRRCDLQSVSRYTSDLWDDLARSINTAARSYAAAYNQEVLRHGPCAAMPSLPPNPRQQRTGAAPSRPADAFGID